MKFHIAVVQCNGQITDRGERSCDQVLSTVMGRQLVTVFDMMLQENLPQLFKGTIRTTLPFGEGGRGEMHYQQAEPFSATAAFFIAGALKFNWFYFCGRDRKPDEIAIRATEECITALASQAGLKNACVKLNALHERPLAVCVPWPPSPSELEQRIVGNYGAGLAVAFFQKTAAFVECGKLLARTDISRN